MPISVNAMRCRANRARPSATALLLIAVISAAATESNPIIKARQENFKTLGRTAKALGDQIGRSSPDWVTITENAKTVEQLTAMIHGLKPARVPALHLYFAPLWRAAAVAALTAIAVALLAGAAGAP